jgi:hypothetical protein
MAQNDKIIKDLKIAVIGLECANECDYCPQPTPSEVKEMAEFTGEKQSDVRRALETYEGLRPDEIENRIVAMVKELS